MIFRDDDDRNQFLERLGKLLKETQTPCLAWALIPNHFHLLLKTGQVLIATLMRRLLTGYAVYFDHRHHRHGRLFQNRYKSILCEEDAYLLELWVAGVEERGDRESGEGAGAGRRAEFGMLLGGSGDGVQYGGGVKESSAFVVRGEPIG
jgi:hypothetical protein